jgi:rare lipoprotein A
MRALLSLLALALLAGCATAPPQASKPEPSKGKYYADDGPPEKVPEDIASIPDAVPRDEPFHRFANRPYTVFGRTYVPVVNREATKERGTASWYGKKFHGRKTASGEVYDMFAMTAAHKTLPLPSFARVTNVKTGQSVIVRINDRGPFHSDRIIDLSYAAAARIGIAAAGSGLVDVERIVPGPGVEDAAATTASVPPPVMARVETPMVAEEAAAYWLQVGAFGSAEAADAFREKVARELAWVLEPIHIAAHDGMHRVRLGPYRNLEEAAAIGDKVRRSLGFAPVLTNR